MDNRSMPIGFFDSGVGGLSVMKEAVKIMPNENFIYFGDSINAPYGTKPVEKVRELTFSAVELLLSKGVKGIAIACNTATSAAVAELRKMYPELPLVGIEPAIKPAIRLNKEGNILVMATPRTLEEKKFKALMDSYKMKQKIIPVPCAGLMEFIEKGILQGPELEEYLREKINKYNQEKIAAIVLGCTHYPFIKEQLYNIVGSKVDIIDGGYGTAKELRRRLKESDLLTTSDKEGSIVIVNSLNDEGIIQLSKKLMEL